MKRYLYEAVFSPNELGGYDVSFPELGIVTMGDDLTDAAWAAQDLLTLHAEGERAMGRDLPESGSFGAAAPDGGAVIGIMAVVGEGGDEADEMTADHAADILGVSRPRVYAMARDGILESRKVGNSLMISAESVRARYSSPREAGRPRKAAKA